MNGGGPESWAPSRSPFHSRLSSYAQVFATQTVRGAIRQFTKLCKAMLNHVDRNKYSETAILIPKTR